MAHISEFFKNKIVIKLKFKLKKIDVDKLSKCNFYFLIYLKFMAMYIPTFKYENLIVDVLKILMCKKNLIAIKSVNNLNG